MAIKKSPLPVMLDTETLGFPRNSAVIDIGMVNLLTAEKFSVQINPENYEALYKMEDTHFHVNDETIQWHQKKGAGNAYDRACQDGIAISLAIDLITDTLLDWAGKDHELQIWCQGTDFDIPVIDNLFAFDGSKLPWKFSQVRDLRTVTALYPDVPRTTWGNHTALEDAIYQGQHLLKIAQKHPEVAALLSTGEVDTTAQRLAQEGLHDQAWDSGERT